MGIARPQEFLESVIKTKSISEALAKTKTEKNYLTREYNTIASLKNGFTVYRNYLKTHIPLTKKLSNKPLLPILLNELRLNPEQQAEFNQAKVTNIKQDKTNLREIYNVGAYLAIAINLLDAISYVDNILGLCALTGRRVAEIGSTAGFKYVTKNTIEFTGQLKTKGNTTPYQIPILFDANKIIATLAKVRQVKPQFINNPALFHNTSKELSIRVKKHFTGAFEGVPTVKDLRAIYALISFTNFHKIPTNKRIDRDVYFSQILGHSKDDITTCGSYVDFFII